MRRARAVRLGALRGRPSHAVEVEAERLAALVHGSAQLDVATVSGRSGSGSTDARGASLMAARTKSKVTPKYKAQYRVRNWPSYEAALKKRGDVTVWFDEDATNA